MCSELKLVPFIGKQKKLEINFAGLEDVPALGVRTAPANPKAAPHLLIPPMRPPKGRAARRQSLHMPTCLRVLQKDCENWIKWARERVCVGGGGVYLLQLKQRLMGAALLDDQTEQKNHKKTSSVSPGEGGAFKLVCHLWWWHHPLLPPNAKLCLGLRGTC